MIALAALMTALIAEMEDGDIAAPLHESFTLALVWNDLARLAGEDVPAEVAAILDGPAVTRMDAERVGRWVPAV